MITPSTVPPKHARPPQPAGRVRRVRCRRCGDRRELNLPPEWDRRTFVEMVCPKCSARALLPTGRLLLLRVLAVIAFGASAAFVIYTLTHHHP